MLVKQSRAADDNADIIKKIQPTEKARGREKAKGQNMRKNRQSKGAFPAETGR